MLYNCYKIAIVLSNFGLPDVGHHRPAYFLHIFFIFFIFFHMFFECWRCYVRQSIFCIFFPYFSYFFIFLKVLRAPAFFLDFFHILFIFFLNFHSLGRANRLVFARRMARSRRSPPARPARPPALPAPPARPPAPPAAYYSNVSAEQIMLWQSLRQFPCSIGLVDSSLPPRSRNVLSLLINQRVRQERA